MLEKCKKMWRQLMTSQKPFAENFQKSKLCSNPWGISGGSVGSSANFALKYLICVVITGGTFELILSTNRDQEVKDCVNAPANLFYVYWSFFSMLTIMREVIQIGIVKGRKSSQCVSLFAKSRRQRTHFAYLST